MANLIIGGNTYKNINRVKIKKDDGTMATFVDSATYAHSPTAALTSVVLGVTGIIATVGSVVIEKIPAPTATIALN